MSYDGGINFGLIGDYEAMPSLGALAADLNDELENLAALAPKVDRQRLGAEGTRPLDRGLLSAQAPSGSCFEPRIRSPSSG